MLSHGLSPLAQERCVGEHRLKFMAVDAKVTTKAMKRGGHGGLRNGWKGLPIEAAGRCWGATVGVDKGEDATATAGRRNGVHQRSLRLCRGALCWRSAFGSLPRQTPGLGRSTPTAFGREDTTSTNRRWSLF